MTYLDGAPLENLQDAPQAVRDQVATALIDLVLRELFVLGAMQTDPNLANYRYDPQSGRIVLLDFGAVQPIAPNLIGGMYLMAAKLRARVALGPMVARYCREDGAPLENAPPCAI